jgi:hypothetical protein
MPQGQTGVLYAVMGISEVQLIPLARNKEQSFSDAWKECHQFWELEVHVLYAEQAIR